MKYKKFIFNVIVFIFILILIHSGLSFVALKAAQSYKQGVFVIGQAKREWIRKQQPKFELGKIKVVFLGNSIILSGIIPEEFDRTFSGKTSTINLALPALPIGPGYFALKDLVEAGEKPDVVVVRLVLDNSDQPGLFDFNVIQGLRFPEEFLSYLIHRKNRAFALNYLVPLRMYTNETIRFLKNALFNREDIVSSKKRNETEAKKMINDRGYYFIRDQNIFPEGRLPEGFDILDPKQIKAIEPGKFIWGQDPYLEKFLEYTQKNGIKVFLIGSIYREFTTGLFTQKPSSCIEISKKYPHVMSGEKSWQSKFLGNYYFSDRVHLNNDGAKIYTRWVAEDFVNEVLNQK
ncbi:MAG: hypothetical protein ACKVQC_04240 [Elusimicrobiota bacterium]